MGLFGNKGKKEEKELRKKQEQLEKELLNEEKIKNKKVSLDNIAAVEEHLEDDEEIIEFLLGMYDSDFLGKETKRNGALFATNKRIIFYGKKTFGYDMETIDYKRISSIDYSKSVVFGEFKIYTSGNNIKFETAMEHTARKMIKIIKEKTADKQGSTSPSNHVEELKGYKELLDMGVLTQEEFDAKKKQLLNI